MSSVVTDVLNSAGVLAKEDIPSKVDSLRRKIEDIKLEVQERLKNRYLEFIPEYVKLDKLMWSLHSSQKEYENLHYHVEKEIKPQMTSSVSEYRELFDELKKISVLKEAVSAVIEMHKNLDASKQSLDDKCYYSAAESILEFDDKAKEMFIEHQKDKDIFLAMKTEYHVAKENAIYHMGGEWTSRVVFNKMGKSRKYASQNELTLHLVSMETFVEAIQALELLKHLDSVVKSFGNQFLSLICEPIISKTVELKVHTTSDKIDIIVSVVSDEQREPHVVLSHLTKIFQVLNEPFASTSVSRNIDSSAEVKTLMIKLGSLIGNALCTSFINNCLKPAVPSQSQDLESFEKTIRDVMNFQQMLVESSFLAGEENVLFQFIQKIDELPANKMSLDLVSQARDLMKRDLHKTVVVGKKENTTAEAANEIKTDDLDHASRSRSSLHKSFFDFPSCQISVFADDLVKLLHQVMKEVKNFESKNVLYAMKLYATARSICELFCCVVPTYHKEEIANIPQQTAVQHNNCMYIAHCLLTLGQGRHAVNLPLPVTFVDLVPEIRKIGTEAFLAQMRIQRQHILDLLQDPEAFQNIAEDSSLNKTEKAIRQCLRQLELLKRVWSDVLPSEVYFKAIGTLLNTFLEEIIQQISSMEDIAAQVAAQLDSVFSIVLRESPELFKTESGDKRDVVHKYVQRWFKFQELQLVLSANLIEIVDRWANGKGVLASHFSIDEMKHLIRALFQNTERRAAALAKIR